MSVLSDLQSRTLALLRKEGFLVEELLTLDVRDLFPPSDTHAAVWVRYRIEKVDRGYRVEKVRAKDEHAISAETWDLLRRVLDERPAPRWGRVFQVGHWYGVRGLRRDEVLVACDSHLCAHEKPPAKVLSLLDVKDDESA